MAERQQRQERPEPGQAPTPQTKDLPTPASRAQTPQTGSPATKPLADAAAERERTSEDDGATTRRLKQDAKETARDLERKAEERADRWTTSMGRQAESLARALRVARDSLWTEGEERMATVVEQAAEQVARVSGYLEDENPSAMLDDLAELGRRNPGAFLGSAFTLGLAAGRFLRASSPDRAEGRGAGEHPDGRAEGRSSRPESMQAHLEASAEAPAGGRR